MDLQEIAIPVGTGQINGDLTLIDHSQSLVIFAHGSGSSRKSPRNKMVAGVLHKANISTLLFDLLTTDEEEIDDATREFRFNIPLLTKRLVTVSEWIGNNEKMSHLHLGYFGSSTGAAAALIAAAQMAEKISAVVSRGGRVDLAEQFLSKVQCPTLLIVGQLDYGVIQLNEKALKELTCIKELTLIPRATHLFEEEGALEKVANVARDWFKKYL